MKRLAILAMMMAAGVAMAGPILVPTTNGIVTIAGNTDEAAAFSNALAAASSKQLTVKTVTWWKTNTVDSLAAEKCPSCSSWLDANRQPLSAGSKTRSLVTTVTRMDVDIVTASGKTVTNEPRSTVERAETNTFDRVDQWKVAPPKEVEKP